MEHLTKWPQSTNRQPIMRLLAVQLAGSPCDPIPQVEGTLQLLPLFPCQPMHRTHHTQPPRPSTRSKRGSDSGFLKLGLYALAQGS